MSTKQTIIDDVEKYGPMACQVLELLFQAETSSKLPTEILAGVSAILNAVKSGVSAKASPDAIVADITALLKGTEADDAAAESAITAKFGPKP